MAMVLKGAPVAKALDLRTASMVLRMKDEGIDPTLAIIRVGNKPEDISYENAAIKRCDKNGISVKQFVLEQEAETEEVVNLVTSLNVDKSVHGILVFLPLPKHIDESLVKNTIAADKDVDGASEKSLAGIFAGNGSSFLPCTARACVELLDHYDYDIVGKKAVVVGRSLVIGKPVAMELLRRNATVTICHTRTKDLPGEIAKADVVVAAAGKAGVVKEADLREGQWVLDVGININDDGKLCGDVSADPETSKAAAVTPVPGGIGNITTAVLARHTAEAAARQNRINFVDF